jgi:hypothetical protein
MRQDSYGGRTADVTLPSRRASRFAGLLPIAKVFGGSLETLFDDSCS